MQSGYRHPPTSEGHAAYSENARYYRVANPVTMARHFKCPTAHLNEAFKQQQSCQEEKIKT
jgi:hypothetical protein